MRIQIGALDFTVGRTKASGQDLVTTFPSDFPMAPNDGWFSNFIRESFSGAWQRNIGATTETAMSHPTFWACVTLIAGDIAKGGFSLVKEDSDGIKSPIDNAAFSPVLRKPNHYQNRIQFLTYWVISKLCRGNAYVLKERDNRNVVVGLYLLDPSRVKTLVSPSGDVYYQIGQDLLSGVGSGDGPSGVVVPASEIIHDLMNPLYHPLVGLSPVYASGHAAMQALQIMRNSSRLTRQGFNPGGVVTAATAISQENAKKFEEMFAAEYQGPDNIGKIIFLGGGLKFEKPPVMSAVDAQLIQLLDWDDHKICSTLHVPPYMVNVGPAPTYNNIEALNQQYYSQCLQILIESMELCLEEGLGVLEAGYEIEYDLDALLRMDSATKMKTETDAVKGGISTPNEARKKFNKKPLKGGDTVYLQQQDFSIEALARRDAQQTPPALPASPSPTPAPPIPPAGKSMDLDEATIEAIAGPLLVNEMKAAA